MLHTHQCIKMQWGLDIFSQQMTMGNQAFWLPLSLCETSVLWFPTVGAARWNFNTTLGTWHLPSVSNRHDSAAESSDCPPKRPCDRWWALFRTDDVLAFGTDGMDSKQEVLDQVGVDLKLYRLYDSTDTCNSWHYLAIRLFMCSWVPFCRLFLWFFPWFGKCSFFSLVGNQAFFLLW